MQCRPVDELGTEYVIVLLMSYRDGTLLNLRTYWTEYNDVQEYTEHSEQCACKVSLKFNITKSLPTLASKRVEDISCNLLPCRIYKTMILPRISNYEVIF